MNNQPYDVPTQHWPPKLTYWWFYYARPLRRNALRKQQMLDVEVGGLEMLQGALDAGQGVLLTPNHSFHWDSYCLLEASDRLETPFYIMTAWQVFALSNRFEKMSMQRCGCFSVDREGTDMTAMKTAVDILQHRREPLVIFPEGDVYHTNDRLTPLRDGAAALALMAARKSERKLVVLPTAIKRWYVDDPTPSLLKTIAQLEQRLYWRSNPNLPLAERILKVADGLLSLKELERFGATKQGTLTERKAALADTILDSIERRHGTKPADGMLPERVKEVRRRIIQQRQELAGSATPEQRRQWSEDMEDVFLVTQLYSYPGDYLIEKPSLERLAETLDKLEEDALGASCPPSRGKMKVRIQFDQPIELPLGKEKKLSPAALTDQIEERIQAMLDTMNADFDRTLENTNALPHT